MDKNIAERAFVADVEASRAGSSSELRYENFMLRAKLRDLDQRIEALETQRQQMLHSRSWRATAPIRSAAALLRRMVGLLRQKPDAHQFPVSLAGGSASADGASSTADTAPGRPRLFVDVTVIAEHDYRSGIQRVVRSILLEWLFAPPHEYAVVPVRLDPGQGYVPAHDYIARLVGGQVSSTPEAIKPTRGDVFLGLDFLRDRSEVAASHLEFLRRSGCRMNAVLYDMLPLQTPQHFTASVVKDYERWLVMITSLADQVICISNDVAEKYRTWIATQELAAAPPKTAVFRLGSHDMALRAEERHFPRARDRRDFPTFLMVGTLEPRKRHDLALSAMDLLWNRGIQARLVIVGQQGWDVDTLVQSIHGHAMFRRKLFWHEVVSDLGLEHHYRAADALLACSDDEGFGLPVAEACARGLPLVLRRLSVFQEVAGSNASYFDGQDAESLANHLHDWINAWRQGDEPLPKCLDYGWTQSARQLAGIV